MVAPAKAPAAGLNSCKASSFTGSESRLPVKDRNRP